MKHSSNYSFYPRNEFLDAAITRYQHLTGIEPATDQSMIGSAEEQGRFIHTHGNFEHRFYSDALFASAREFFQSSLNDISREEAPLDWAALNVDLGNIVAASGQYQDSDELLVDAARSFEQALEIYSAEDTPQEWASSQYCLGLILQARAMRKNDSKLYKQSVDAFTAALTIWTRQENPLAWGLTMHQLGSSFHAHGLLLKGNRTLQKSDVAYKGALSALNADDAALLLAATYNNRGTVLHHLSESDENPDRMEEAIRSYESALSVLMGQQLAMHLTVRCRVNKAAALTVLAELSRDASVAQDAADDLEVIIEVFQSSCPPSCIDHCKERLQHAQSLISELSDQS